MTIDNHPNCYSFLLYCQFFCRSSSEMETKKRKTGMNVALFLMAAILAEPCSAYLSPDIGMICQRCLQIVEFRIRLQVCYVICFVHIQYCTM
jgi:hypothetical protein